MVPSCAAGEGHIHSSSSQELPAGPSARCWRSWCTGAGGAPRHLPHPLACSPKPKGFKSTITARHRQSLPSGPGRLGTGRGGSAVSPAQREKPLARRQRQKRSPTPASLQPCSGHPAARGHRPADAGRSLPRLHVAPTAAGAELGCASDTAPPGLGFCTRVCPRMSPLPEGPTEEGV